MKREIEGKGTFRNFPTTTRDVREKGSRSGGKFIRLSLCTLHSVAAKVNDVKNFISILNYVAMYIRASFGINSVRYDFRSISCRRVGEACKCALADFVHPNYIYTN